MTKEELKEIAQIDYALKNLSFDNINNIEIIKPNSQFKAKINPVYISDKLFFDIFLDYNVVNNLSSSDADKQEESLSIVLHELFHYKECIITSRNMDYHRLISDDSYSNTYTMVLSIGYKQWAEYYAYYNSFKYYQRNILFADISQSWAALKVMRDALINNVFIKMPFSLYSNIKEFISNAIMFAAQYNLSLDSNLLKLIEKYKDDKHYYKHYEYITELVPYMDDLYKSYPDWVSESKFIEIGKYLLNILQRYNITYSTSNLSDNFTFIKSEKQFYK